jgi:hypothetical protein
MAISLLSMSAPHPTSSICCGFSTSLLRILISQYNTSKQKSTHTYVFCFTNFYFTLTKNNTRPAIVNLCTHKHLDTARDWVLIYISTVYNGTIMCYYLLWSMGNQVSLSSILYRFYNFSLVCNNM